ncbi:MAG: DUF433 domain-containing protein [Anaerolineae bacterium]|nr:DUF433 domain-containing protein [Anaerolineae bacterium]
MMKNRDELLSEMVGGEKYEYHPLGQYIVRAPGICGGRPTFKYTRIEVSVILGRIAQGISVDDIVVAYNDPHLTHEAIYEAMMLANAAFLASPPVTTPLAV